MCSLLEPYLSLVSRLQRKVASIPKMTKSCPFFLCMFLQQEQKRSKDYAFFSRLNSFLNSFLSVWDYNQRTQKLGSFCPSENTITLMNEIRTQWNASNYNWLHTKLLSCKVCRIMSRPMNRYGIWTLGRNADVRYNLGGTLKSRLSNKNRDNFFFAQNR